MHQSEHGKHFNADRAGSVLSEEAVTDRPGQQDCGGLRHSQLWLNECLLRADKTVSVQGEDSAGKDPRPSRGAAAQPPQARVGSSGSSQRSSDPEPGSHFLDH